MNNRVDIQFKGLTTSPSDYACSDGELAICHNLINENGELRPVMPPKELDGLSRVLESIEARVLCVHRGSDFKNIIAADGESDDIVYIAVDDDYKVLKKGIVFERYTAEITSAETIGDILVLVTSNGLHFARFGYSREVRSYIDLGHKIPEIPSISFGLVYNEDAVEQHTAEVGEGYMAFSDAVYGALSAAEAAANKEGLFSYPCFIRYAYRLYDGTNVMPSAPFLIIPISDSRQLVRVSGTDQRKAISELMAMKLYYRVVESVDLGNWGDLIEGVDLFATLPFRPHETRKEVSETATSGSNPHHTMGVYNVCQTAGGKVFPDTIAVDGFQVRELPFKQESKYAVFASRDVTDLVESSAFYHFGFIPNSSLRVTNVARKAPVDYYALDTLSARPVLKDEYMTHQMIKPEDALNYNSRLVVSNIARELYSGQSPASFFPPCPLLTNLGDDMTNSMEMYVKIEKNGVEYMTKRVSDVCLDISNLLDINEGNDSDSHGSLKGRPLLYFYFPDPDAKSVVINLKNGDDGFYVTTELELRRHPILGGAYWFEGLTRDAYANFKAGTTVKSPSADLTIKQKSAVYLSEVNNPFYFPAEYSTSVGTGSIMRVVASTRPLSEGQFGEFPLAAFTTEGIWAISINNEGRASARQPISRSVLSSKHSLCNLDSAVAFISNDGVNILEGSKVTCISDSLEKAFFDTKSLPRYESLVSEFDLLPNMPNTLFMASIKSANVFQSSRFGRIYVQPSNRALTFMYSTDTGLWSTTELPIVSDVVEDYPETLIINDMGGAYNVDRETETLQPITLLTRPLKLNGPDVPKTLHEGIVRGFFDRTIEKKVVDAPDAPTSSGQRVDIGGDLGDLGGGSNIGGNGGGLEGETGDGETGGSGTGTGSGGTGGVGNIGDGSGIGGIGDGGGTGTGGDIGTITPTVNVVRCDVKQVLYGSNDLKHWYAVSSSADQYLRGRFGTPYKFFRLLVIAPSTLDESKCVTGATFDVQPRLNNTLR